MSFSFDYLNDFEKYCAEETYLEDKKYLERYEYNYQRIIKQIKLVEQNLDSEKYLLRKKKADIFVSGLELIHNTTLECLLTILKQKSLLSVNQIDKSDLYFDSYNHSYYLDEGLRNYIFLSFGGGNWINGLYEIRFKKEIENYKKGVCYPKGVLNYLSHELGRNVLDIKRWRDFLAENISLSFEDPEDYLKLIPLHLRPVILIENEISIDYIEEISCGSISAFEALISSIKNLPESSQAIIDKITLFYYKVGR